jgi:hypothetical protein
MKIADKAVIQLSVGFSILFAAFNACNSLISKIYDDLHLSNLGQINTFTMYLCFAFSNLFATKMSSMFKHPKYVVLAGSILYATYYIGGIFTGLCNTSWFGWRDQGICGEFSLKAINIFFSVVIGVLGGTLLWNGQYAFIVWFSKKSERGRHFGMFYGIAQFSNIIGNGINAVYYSVDGAETF